MGMSKEGWISIYRKIQECVIWLSDEPYDRRSAWIDLLLTANHRDTELLFDGKMITVTRGQLVTSVRKLADRWGWGKDKTLAYLRLLEELGMIKKESDSRRTLLTIENYSIYQVSDENSRQSADTKQTVSRHRPATNNNVNNENKLNITYLVDESSLSDGVKQKVYEWLKYKKERREGYKETGLQSLITQITKKEAEYGSQAVIEVISLSMSQGWKGIIWDKMNKPNKVETKFHNFDMKHNYDFDEMERRLLQ